MEAHYAGFCHFILSAVLFAVPAFAFHSGGVGACEGCHSMHNSVGGSVNVVNAAQYHSGPYLLRAQNASCACLNCHQSPYNVGPHFLISTVGNFFVGIDSAPANLPPQWRLWLVEDGGWRNSEIFCLQIATAMATTSFVRILYTPGRGTEFCARRRLPGN